MMGDYRTITEAAVALRRGEVTSVELVQRAVEVADATDPVLGIFLNRFTDSAVEAAARADAALASGTDPGPLAGIPVGIKDNLATHEAPCTAQSLVHDRSWFPGDAVAVARLRAAGGIVLGKTTTMEFALGTPDPDKPFPYPRNPWNTDRWAGGSSSGSGSGVAVGAVLGALGTDTGGSIRIPSAFCGITGLKPTFGRVPKSGCVPAGYSLDAIGPMARSARDCAVMLRALAGHDASDTSSASEPVPDYVGSLTGDLHGLRIGVDRLDRYAGSAEDPAVPGVLAAAVEELERLGAEVIEVELPHYAELTAAAMVIMACDAFAYHLPDLRARWSDFFASTRLMVAPGAMFSAGDYVQAQRVRGAGRRALAELFADVDIVVTPTVSAGAIDGGEPDEIFHALSYGGLGPLNTPYWNGAGGPALTVPAGFTAGGMPLAMQIAGRPFDEATVLRVGDAFQSRTSWHLRMPDATRLAMDRPSADLV